MTIKHNRTKKFLLLIPAGLSLASCSFLNEHGKKAEEIYGKDYHDGTFEALKTDHPMPDIKKYDADGHFDEIGYITEEVRIKKIWAEKSKKSCEAAKSISEAYKKDYFSSEKAKYWSDHDGCVMADEFRKALSDGQSELSERMQYYNSQTRDAINKLNKNMIDLGIN